MRPVVVLIFHAPAPHGAGQLTGALAEARRSLAERQRDAFLAAGADSAEIVEGPPGPSFGERLAAETKRRLRRGGKGLGGLVVTGSGSMTLARSADLRAFVETAAGPEGRALANNRYSADCVAVSRPADLLSLPPLPADNALPRWLEERAGVAVRDLHARWRLGVDVDTPVDLLLLERAGEGPGLPAALAGLPTLPLIGERLGALHSLLHDRRAEVLVAGRISSTTLHWLERNTACRIRALVEERGLRAASRLAQPGDAAGHRPPRPPRSVLGELLDREAPESIARVVERLADGAVIDTRVLLAHRHGLDETAWPSPEERYASDLFLPASVGDPWLRALTVAASTRPSLPILLGGHTAVNGALRLLAGRRGPVRTGS